MSASALFIGWGGCDFWKLREVLCEAERSWLAAPTLL
jgi:hypothetical protein